MRSPNEFFTNLDANFLNLQSTADRDGSITLTNQKIKDHGHYRRITQYLSLLLRMGSVGLVL